ncbi:hypothetical protein [Haloarchaeobius sp. TZWWS8]|uniref:hypothetical protein n=1 Tax=Haloarchaeobius sp. TZWWS8 TaxID=3446121 RepID=UPI003EBA18A4
MRPRPAICCALLVVLAGCGGFAGSQQTRDPFTVDETATPAGTDTPTTAGGSSGQFHPDPENDTIGDPRVFLTSQARALNGTSYTVGSSYSVHAGNGSLLYRSTGGGSFAANRTRFVSSIQTGGSIPPREQFVAVFADGERVYTKERRNGSSQVRLERGPDGDPIDPSQATVKVTGRGQETQFLYTFFDAVNVTSVDKRFEDRPGLDGPLYAIRGTGTAEDLVVNPVPNVAGNATNLSLTALVDSRGFVVEFHVSYDVHTEDGVVHVERSLYYEDIGETTVQTPPEVESYLNGTNETTTSTPAVR